MIEYKYIKQALDEYRQDMYLEACAINNIKLSDAYSNDIQNIVKSLIDNDLLSNGFDKDEINEISEQLLSTETAYKFLAYFLKSLDQYDSIDKLVPIIEKYTSFDIEDFSTDDLNKIVEAKHKLE